METKLKMRGGVNKELLFRSSLLCSAFPGLDVPSSFGHGTACSVQDGPRVWQDITGWGALGGRIDYFSNEKKVCGDSDFDSCIGLDGFAMYSSENVIFKFA